MKKLLALVAVTSLVVNSSAAGAVLLNNNIQNNLNKVTKDINNLQLNQNQAFNSVTDIIDLLLKFIKNKSLSSDFIIKIIDGQIKGLKTNNPEIVEYLSYAKYGPFLSLAAQELANDWDQQKDYGDSPLEAMKNYIASEKGDITHAKKVNHKGEWHYVEVRARNWTWNDFYQYMAGANLDYMINILSGGNYIGNLVNNHLDLGPWKYGFDKDAFLNDLTSAIAKLPTTKEAWPYLIRAIIPILKSKILNEENPTIGYDNLTWEKTSQKDLSLQTLLKEMKRLLSPDGRNDLINILASLLSGPFGEDIIINAYMLGYYTFPEVLEVLNKPPLSWVIGDSLKPTVIAGAIVDQLINITNDLGIVDIVDNILNKADGLISENIVIDFKSLSIDLSKIYETDAFEIGLEQLIDIINNPETSKYSLKEIFKIWGTQEGEEDFKQDSPLFILKKWIDDPKSILNQVLNVLRKIEINKIII